MIYDFRELFDDNFCANQWTYLNENDFYHLGSGTNTL